MLSLAQSSCTKMEFSNVHIQLIWIPYHSIFETGHCVKTKNAVSKDVVGMPLFDALLISLVVRFDSVGVFRSSFPSPLTKFSNNASLLAGNAGVAALQISMFPNVGCARILAQQHRANQ